MEVTAVLDIFLPYVTASHCDNVVKKLTDEERKDDCKVVRLIIDDVWNHFCVGLSADMVRQLKKNETDINIVLEMEVRTYMMVNGLLNSKESDV
jgi:hypothetical protein